MDEFHFSNQELTITELSQVVSSKVPVKLSLDAQQKVQQCRHYLDQKVLAADRPIYGINTGFGSLCNTTVSHEDLAALQRNLVVSHACGMGETIPQDVVRYMILLKIHALSKGYSGVQVDTVQRLIDLYNNGYLPVVYAQGSLGASGDLAPLAHLSLPLIGEGAVWHEGAPKPTKEVYWSLGWEAIKLQSKEGLALLNGTQFMSAYGAYIVDQATDLLAWADLIAAMSLEAFDALPEPFVEGLHELRRQAGQTFVAERIRNILADSKLMQQPKQQVQDPYSFRCIPQVHGASVDALNYVRTVVENEMNAVTDNPTIFVEQDQIVSGGNFHGQPMALALDFLAIALAEIGSISERRTFKLISGQRNLPPFLVAQPGLNSGFMIPQYTAASIVSQNKQWCTPASVDSIDSSNGQEDHVSMGANAATKAFRVLENLKSVLAIELLNAAQALEFRDLTKTSSVTKSLHERYRKNVPYVAEDEYMRPLIVKSVNFINNNKASSFMG